MKYHAIFPIYFSFIEMELYNQIRYTAENALSQVTQNNNIFYLQHFWHLYTFDRASYIRCVASKLYFWWWHVIAICTQIDTDVQLTRSHCSYLVTELWYPRYHSYDLILYMTKLFGFEANISCKLISCILNCNEIRKKSDDNGSIQPPNTMELKRSKPSWGKEEYDQTQCN